MFLLTGILVLVLVCAASVSLAAATGRDAAVFPLPIFAGAVCLLLAGGCLGAVPGIDPGYYGQSDLPRPGGGSV